MSESVILWIFGALMLIGGGWMAWLTRSVENLTNEQSSLTNQVTHLRMTLIMISEQAAKLLHADDNYHGMDQYIDKLTNPKYNLTKEEWDRFLHLAENTMNNPDHSRHDRFLAAVVFHISRNLQHQNQNQNQKTI
jgi:hypothetical protein